ncbi:MAG: hypothetical protein IPK82_36995 [Polyangiaceae bacterium]|nr:hypothetical protein [Polyangiaceae bacterium]
MERTSWMLGLGAAIALMGGCLPGGERAQNNNPWGDGGSTGIGGSGGDGDNCLPGETCSDKTPQGLHFMGPSTFDSFFSGGPKAMAVGGTQTIKVYWDNQGNFPFDLPFDAHGTGVVEIKETSPSEVLVGASDPGTGYLRLTEAGTNLLYDRFQLSAFNIDKVELAPIDMYPALGAEPPSAPWVALASSTMPVALLLWNGQTRLVDEGVTLTLAGDATPLENSAKWDAVWLTAAATGAFTVEAKAPTFSTQSITVKIVSKADKITPLVTALGNFPTGKLGLEESEFYCFRPYSGTNPVAGTNWEYNSSAGLEVADEFFPGCVTVRGLQLGTQSLTVKGAGAQLTLDIEVITAASGNKSTLPKLPKPGRPIYPGDRVDSN